MNEFKWYFIAIGVALVAMCAAGAVDSWSESQIAIACVSSGQQWNGIAYHK